MEDVTTEAVDHLSLFIEAYVGDNDSVVGLQWAEQALLHYPSPDVRAEVRLDGVVAE